MLGNRKMHEKMFDYFVENTGKEGSLDKWAKAFFRLVVNFPGSPEQMCKCEGCMSAIENREPNRDELNKQLDDLLDKLMGRTTMTTMPDIALLDGDLMAWGACFADKRDGRAGGPPPVRRQALDPSEVSRSIVAFSPSRKDNYRQDFWPVQGPPRREALAAVPAAGHPILKDNFESVMRPRIEADDILGMGMSSGQAIAVTLDKDLRSCPGWLWNPEKQGFPELISEEEADRGSTAVANRRLDRPDPGDPPMGDKGAQKLLDSTPPQNWSAMVMAYEQSAQDVVSWRVDGKQKRGTRAEHLEETYSWETGQDLDYCLAQARCVGSCGTESGIK